MERMTKRWGEGDVWVKDHDYVSAAHRLADYEDTGLTPEEVCLLARADKEGRVMCYKPGDTVQDRFGMAWTVTTSEIHLMRGVLRYLYRCGHDGTNDYCALWENEILTSGAKMDGGAD